MEKIFFDNNATTPLDPRVIDAMAAEMALGPANASSHHFFGKGAKARLEQARRSIAHHLGVHTDELIFTSGATESLNTLIRSLTKGGHIITTAIEHAAVFETVKSLNLPTTYLPVDERGAPEAHTLEKAIRPDTTLLIFSAVNSETGVKLDLEAFAKVALEKNIPFILDGVALLGKESFTLPEGVSAAAFSAHKLHGPKGVGALFLRRGVKCTPLLTGGGQEKGMRSGTENLVGIVGFAKALEIAEGPKNFRDLFEAELKNAAIPFEVNGTAKRIWNTSNLYFPTIDAESLLIQLDLAGIAASHGSACASGALEPSRTLLAMGYPRERVLHSIRFSFSRFNTIEEIQYTINKIKEIHKCLIQ